jgi:hypothetical protein
MSIPVNNPVPVGFDTLPILDLRNPDFTIEGNRLLVELRAKGPLCSVEPLGSLGFLLWADCDAILRDFRTFSAEFARSQPVPGAEEETKIDTLLREDPPKPTLGACPHATGLHARARGRDGTAYAGNYPQAH